jgi:cytochrome c peroxidase
MDKERPNNLLELDVGKDTRGDRTKRWRFLARFLNKPIAFLLKTTKFVVSFVTGIFSRPLRQGSSWSKKIKSSGTIAALVLAAVLAGHTVSAQVSPPPNPPPLNSVKVPEPENIGDFIRDKTAAIALGKSLFWDMQLGSDGIQSCASCHFHAGADNRSKNQLNPGQKGGDNTFNIAGRPNYQLAVGDYPFHKLADPNNIQSNVLSDTNDVTGSQGVFKTKFVDIVPGSDKDNVTPQQDDVFNVNGTNVRQVTDRHSPSVINAVFNFRNFWDGRAQNVFNGVNEFGLRDPDAFVLKAARPNRLTDVKVSLKNSSLASQAVGPPLSAFETASEDLPIAPLTVDLSEGNNQVTTSNATRQDIISNSSGELSANSLPAEDSANRSLRRPSQPTTPLKRIGRKLGKKLSALTPLGKQLVATDDSVIGRYSRGNQPGLSVDYPTLIETAFKPEWWNSNIVIQVDPNTGQRTFTRKPSRKLTTTEYTLMEYNFSLFFGLAVQAYESTLVSDNTPFDQFLAGNTGALTAQQQRGFTVFNSSGCIGCHAGAELTAASVSTVTSRGRITRAPVIAGSLPGDTGFFKIGVRPDREDLGLGGQDPFKNPLSEARLAQQGTFKQLLGEDPPNLNPPLNSNETVVADGAFKAPGLRNIELTAPYFHNGGQLTLRQVVDFYTRGGDFGGLRVLNLNEEDKQALVAFMQGLTDDRVRLDKAPFDHPQLFVPNGHPGDQNSVTRDGSTIQATDQLLEIPAVGRNGNQGTPNFLAS